jgi:hypothetical protein
MKAFKRLNAVPALLCTAIALSACTTMGSGTGAVSPGNEPVAFSWKSTDGGISGTMSARLDTAQTFSGPYQQITSDVRSDGFAPMWTGWDYGWNDWQAWRFPQPAFTTLYSGRVLANLQTADGQRMRCHFNLNHPAEGMASGGQGNCQLKGGRTVDALFPAA